LDFGLIDIIWTVVVMILFIGIVIWAYSGKRRKAFDEAARIPLEDDDLPTAEDSSKEKPHG
jgi:cbb3-type cytochrome oxidase subunit 3